MIKTGDWNFLVFILIRNNINLFSPFTNPVPISLRVIFSIIKNK